MLIYAYLTNTSALRMCLEDEGFKVDSFNDPILALLNFKPNFYSLSILDINMSSMSNGYEFYRDKEDRHKSQSMFFDGI